MIKMDAEEKFIGTMSMVDEKLLWCTYSQKIVSPMIGEVMMLIMVDNNILLKGNHCELEGCCYNYECEYNQDKNISSHRDVLEDHEFTEEGIKTTQGNLDAFTESIKKDKDLLEKLNNGWLVVNVFEWDGL